MSTSTERCYMEKQDYNATIDYNCEGAFTFIPLWNSAGTHVHTLTCEGAMSTVTAVTGDVCPEGQCFTGSVCLSNSLIIRADSVGYQEQAFYCNQFAAYGNGVKTDSAAAGKSGRKGWLHHADDDNGSVMMAVFLQSLSAGLQTGTLIHTGTTGERSALIDSAAGVEEDVTDTGVMDPLLIDVAMMKTAWHPSKEYTHTCNGKKIHRWLSWWPCWGALESAYKFADEHAMLEFRAGCHGFSIPKLRLCRGFSTVHSKSKGQLGDKVVGTESMEVTNGKKRVVSRIWGDLALEMSYAKGPTSVHSKLLGIEGEPPEDVKRTVAAIINSAGKGEFQEA